MTALELATFTMPAPRGGQQAIEQRSYKIF